MFWRYLCLLRMFSFPQGFGMKKVWESPGVSRIPYDREASDRSKSALEAADRRLARCEYDLKAPEALNGIRDL